MGEAYLEDARKIRTRLVRPVSLGRSSGNDIVVSGTEVSRRHTLVNPQSGGEVWVVDLGSTNGTYLNERRVLRPTRLQHGDRLNVGGHLFTFHGPPPGPAPGAANPGETAVMTQPVVRTEKAWLLLSDIEDFTSFSQRYAPEEVSRQVGSWVLACSTIFQKHGADIQIYLGDGFFAYFPEKGTESGRFFAVLRELRKTQTGPSELPFRLVVHHAQIALGATAPGGIESILGPGVNFLFRMEKVAAQLKVRCSATVAAVERWPAPRPAFASLGRHALKGFEGEHELYQL